MKNYLPVLFFLFPMICFAQSRKDTIKGVVRYTSYSLVQNYHTVTAEATAIKTDTGIISIKTQYGYIDLQKQYEFIPMNKLQPTRLKSKP